MQQSLPVPKTFVVASCCGALFHLPPDDDNDDGDDDDESDADADADADVDADHEGGYDDVHACEYTCDDEYD